MRSIQKLLILSFVLSLFLIPLSYAQTEYIETTIEEIINNPGGVVKEKVKFEGVVAQKINQTPTTTGHYLIRGDYGAILTVNYSIAPPKVGKRYEVAGVIFIDIVTQAPFLSEQKRIEIKDPLIKWLMISAGILILFLIALFVYQARLKNQPQKPNTPEDVIKEEPVGGKQRDDLKTVKIITPPKTMKFIPGELIIISGGDSGKSFKIAGYPTTEGNVVTIGREKVTGDRAYSHIQLTDSMQTVSRKQAKIISRSNSIYVKNLSEVNYTQVNGQELGLNEEVELTPDSTIKMGSIELQYKLF